MQLGKCFIIMKLLILKENIACQEPLCTLLANNKVFPVCTVVSCRAWCVSQSSPRWRSSWQLEDSWAVQHEACWVWVTTGVAMSTSRQTYSVASVTWSLTMHSLLWSDFCMHSWDSYWFSPVVSYRLSGQPELTQYWVWLWEWFSGYGIVSQRYGCLMVIRILYMCRPEIIAYGHTHAYADSTCD